MDATLAEVLTNFSKLDPVPALLGGKPRFFATDAEAVNYLSLSNTSGLCRFGVHFTAQAPDYTYALRFDAVPGGYVENAGPFARKGSWRTERTFQPPPGGQGPRGDDRGEGDMEEGTDDPGYYKFHFLYWQHAVNAAILANALEADPVQRSQAMAEMERVQLRRFPFPEYTQDGYLFAIQFGLPFLLMLSLVYVHANTSGNKHRNTNPRGG